MIGLTWKVRPCIVVRTLIFSLTWNLGPVYVFGAPNRQIEPGKAVIATVAELKGE